MENKDKEAILKGLWDFESDPGRFSLSEAVIFPAMESYSASQNSELKKENEEWKQECERLACVANFWQKKYYELNPRHQNPKLDNL